MAHLTSAGISFLPGDVPQPSCVCKRTESRLRREHYSQIDTRHKKGLHIMNRDRYQGVWMQCSGKLIEQWGKLIHDQLTIAAGVSKQLAGRMQEHRGMAQQKTEGQLADFVARNRDWQDISTH